MVGFSVYGGGGIHEYELEVLVDDVSTTLSMRFGVWVVCQDIHHYNSAVVQIQIVQFNRLVIDGQC